MVSTSVGHAMVIRIFDKMKTNCGRSCPKVSLDEAILTHLTMA